MKDQLVDKASLLVSVLDQAAAKHENEGELGLAEADKKLAESAANLANTLRNIFQRIEKRILNRICNEGKMDPKSE